MENIYNMKDSLEVGKIGENVALKWLTYSIGKSIDNVIDVRDNPTYRKEDVDFIVTYKNGLQCKIEVKTDQYTTGRLCYEVISSKESNSSGCMRKSTADVLFYYFNNWDRLYVFDFKPYKDWCEKNLNTLGKRFATKTKTVGKSGSTYQSENVYFELAHFKNKSFCTIYENISEKLNLLPE